MNARGGSRACISSTTMLAAHRSEIAGVMRHSSRSRLNAAASAALFSSSESSQRCSGLRYSSVPPSIRAPSRFSPPSSPCVHGSPSSLVEKLPVSPKSVSLMQP